MNTVVSSAYIRGFLSCGILVAILSFLHRCNMIKAAVWLSEPQMSPCLYLAWITLHHKCGSTGINVHHCTIRLALGCGCKSTFCFLPCAWNALFIPHAGSLLFFSNGRQRPVREMHEFHPAAPPTLMQNHNLCPTEPSRPRPFICAASLLLCIASHKSNRGGPPPQTSSAPWVTAFLQTLYYIQRFWGIANR